MRALAAFVVSLCLTGCTQVFFQPNQMLVTTPGQFGVDYQRMEFKAEDGTGLFAWFLPARGEAKASVLYLHGNAENISTHFANVAWMPAAGFNVLALDYRGYGASEGKPSLRGVQMDIDAAMRALIARPDVDPARIYIFGQSLGGALAIYYGAHTSYRANVRAIIVDSPFSDYRLIAEEKLASTPITWPFQWLPRLTVENDYSPIAAVKAVSPIPLLFIHGDQDGVVPVEHSERLYQGAAQPKELWVLHGVGHIQSMKVKSIRDRLTAFLRRHADEQTAKNH